MDSLPGYDVWLTTNPNESNELVWEQYTDAFLTNEYLTKYAQLALDNDWSDSPDDAIILERLAEAGAIPTFAAYSDPDYWRA